MHCVHESQQLRNEIKENLDFEPTCIDRIDNILYKKYK